MKTRVYTDTDGKKWLVNENGEYLRDEHGLKIQPQHSTVISKPGEFTIYDSSNGHCALCGSLRCIGNCFK
jgi:beta-xylosidase